MANRIKGITVKINGDTTNLSDSLAGLDKDIKHTQSQLKDVEKLLKLDPTNTELLAQKQRLLGDAIDDTKDRLETLKTASEKAAQTKDNYDDWKAKYDPIKKEIDETSEKLKALKEQSEKANEQLANGEISQETYDSLQREIDETSDKLKNLKQDAKKVSDEFGNPISPEQFDSIQREIIETEQELQNLQSEAENSRTALVQIGKAGEGLQNVGGKISDAGQKLLPLTAAIGGFGTVAANKFSEVDKTMQLVNSTMENTEEQENLLNSAMKNAAANSTFGMNDAANATLNFARAGLTAEQAASALAPAMNLTAGEGGNLDTVSAGLVSTINGFHGSFDEAVTYADVFAAACNNSALDVDSLSEAMSVAAPIFSSAGYKINDAALYMGIMANNGIDADTAANSLKTGLARLVSPAKDGAVMMEQLGLSISNTDGSMKDSVVIQEELHKAFSKLSESEQIAAASAIFGKNQMAPWLALINTAPEDVGKLSNALDESSGTTDKMASAMMSGFGGSIEKLKSSIDVLITSLGQLLAEYLIPIITKIQEWIDKFNGLDSESQNLIIKVALIAAALGPLLIVVGKTISTVGTLMQFISKIPTIIASAKTAFATLSGAISGISAPVVAIIAIITTLVVAFVHLWNTNEDFKNSILEIWEKIKMTFENLISGIVDKLNALGFSFNDITEVIKAVWNSLCLFLKPVFEGVFQEIADIFKLITDAILGVFDIFIGIFTGNWTQVWNGIKDIFSGVWDFIKSTFENILNMLCDILGTDLETVKTFWIDVWNSVCNFFVNIWNGIVEFITPILKGIELFFETIWNDISTVISTVMNVIHSVITTIWNAISGFISGILNSIWFVISSIWNSISSTVSSVLNTILSVVSNIWNSIKTTISNVMNRIKTNILNVWNSVKTAVSNTITGIKETIVNGFNNAVNFVKNLADEAWSWGSDIIKGIVDGIKSKINDVADAVTGVADKIRSFLHFSVPDEGPLTDFESWMPDFMQGLADGISANSGIVEEKISGFANNITSKIKNIIDSSLKAVLNTTEQFLAKICTLIQDVWNSVKNTIDSSMKSVTVCVNSGWKNISDGIKNITNSIKSSVTDVWNTIFDSVGHSMHKIQDTVLSIWENVKNGVWDRIQNVRNTIADGLNSATDYIRNIVNSSWQWGYDIIQNLINGINYQMADLINTVADVARSIWEYLHFSVPEKGPLTDFESWMPDFMGGLAEGINKSKKYVQSAIKGVSEAMKITMDSDFSYSLDGISGAMINGGSTGTVINNYNNNNSRTVNQTNNSPKSLSRLEIYRQTRNALRI